MKKNNRLEVNGCFQAQNRVNCRCVSLDRNVKVQILLLAFMVIFALQISLEFSNIYQFQIN
jgi:hypothetical protein